MQTLSGPQAIDELLQGLAALEFSRVEEGGEGDSSSAAEEKRIKLEPYEICALINLNPSTVAAAKSLIPSLERLTDEEVEHEVLKLLRRSSARYTGLE